ncbi:ATP synthase subunit I [Allopusillimonas ginsengisoli]|uniref:ATP synthase subunit I n=1 Tax=Allopusillimonas ginsengisoli TaxID=453575 RepID=UPI0039C4BC33
MGFKNTEGSDKPSETEGGGDTRLVLTERDRAAINQRASKGIVRVIVAQAIMLSVAVLASWLVSGRAAAASALIGGCAYLVPNAIFALRLLVGLWGPAQSSPFTFFVGEAFKLGTAVIVLGLAAWLGSGWVVWPALVVGLLFVLKGYVLLLASRRLP